MMTSVYFFRKIDRKRFIQCSIRKLTYLSMLIGTAPLPPRRGECVRLKNFVINANITGNTIEHCGMFDFEFAENSTTDGKNGEGIYIGTSSNQVGGGVMVSPYYILNC